MFYNSSGGLQSFSKYQLKKKWLFSFTVEIHNCQKYKFSDKKM